MIAVRQTRGKAAKDPGAKYAKLLETHQRLEAELSRAMNRWQKSRLALWRAEKRLDKAWADKGQRTGPHVPEFNDKI